MIGNLEANSIENIKEVILFINFQNVGLIQDGEIEHCFFVCTL
jgi:hypothetical protein